MCGIAGFLSQHVMLAKDKALSVLEAMCRTIAYRGPDDHGTYFYGFNGSKDKVNVGLGHNRLSIIDLSAAAHQPMSNENGSVWVAYNGEIYNFREIRELLLQKGHIFKSMSDTEVIVHGWEEWKEGCLERFNGMFAIALWDERESVLFLARDRMGKKPLYYAQVDGGVVFASEPKAILQFPSFRKELDVSSLKKYLLFEYVPSPHTIYKNIKRLEAGTYLFWKDASIHIRRYWDISFKKTARKDHEAGLRNILKDSVDNRLISDVPLGVFLSGGIDSSSIASFMAECMPPKQVKSFTIGFEDRSFDESDFARTAAGYLHTSHAEQLLQPRVMLEILPEIFDFLDEPFADASIVPTYLLSRFTRQQVKVALGGDGGDELFAGYDTFQAHKLAVMYQKIPSWVRKHVFEKIAYHLPVSFDNMSFDFKLKQFLKGIPYPAAVRNQVWLGSFAPDEQECLLRPDILHTKEPADILEDIHAALGRCDGKELLDVITYLYCKFYLQDDILVKVDRASMACSLEVRAPFLDYRVVEYACGLPSSEKLKGLKTKHILKKAMHGYLPEKILKRNKKGFGMPVAKWIRADLKSMITDELSAEKIEREGIFNGGYIQKLLSEHFAGKKDNRKFIWTLFMFELWYKKWFLNK